MKSIITISGSFNPKDLKLSRTVIPCLGLLLLDVIWFSPLITLESSSEPMVRHPE